MSAPAVAVSADGKKVAIAWKDMRTGEPNIYWTTSHAAPPSTDFAEESLLHNETSGKQDHPTLCIDSAGKVWAGWEDARDGSQRIWIRSPLRKEGLAISHADESPASYPTLASSEGRVAVVYEVDSKGKKLVRFRALKNQMGSQLH